VRRNHIDVAHFHNIFPVMSPSVYRAAREGGAAVVQTLHNFRLLCPGNTMFRDNQLCADCVGKPVPWPSVLHACYRGDRQATAVSAAMLAFHRARGTWSSNIDVYVALSEFNRSLFCRAGFADASIFVKPNFLRSDPGPGVRKRTGALFVGRLIPEKGISILLTAWKRIGSKLPLTIIGDGPLRDEVASAAKSSDGAIRRLGSGSRVRPDFSVGMDRGWSAFRDRKFRPRHSRNCFPLGITFRVRETRRVRLSLRTGQPRIAGRDRREVSQAAGWRLEHGRNCAKALSRHL